MSPDTLIKCLYCGLVKFGCEMTKVPIHNKKLLKKWIERLGEEFAKNVKQAIVDSSKHMHICRYHFDPKHGRASRKINWWVLPIANKDYYKPCSANERNKAVPIVAEPMKYCSRRSCKVANEDLKIKCVYCQRKKVYSKMTSVPLKERKLKEWIAILGDCFAENVKRNGFQSYICLSHFNLPPGSTRRRHDVPVANMDTLPPDSDEDLTDPNLPSTSNSNPNISLSPNVDTSLNTMRVLNELGQAANFLYFQEYLSRQAFLNRTNIPSTSNFANNQRFFPFVFRLPTNPPIQTNFPSASNFAISQNVSASLSGTIQAEINQNMNQNRPNLVSREVSVPSNPNSANNRSSDPHGQFSIARILPQIVASDNVPDNIPAETAPTEMNQNIGQDEPLNVSAQHQANDDKNPKNRRGRPSKKIRDYDPKLCAYCEKMKGCKKRRYVPQNETGLNKWIAILGERFEANVKKRPISYICSSHFELEPGKTKIQHGQLPVANSITDSDDDDIRKGRPRKKINEENQPTTSEQRMNISAWANSDEDFIDPNIPSTSNSSNAQNSIEIKDEQFPRNETRNADSQNQNNSSTGNEEPLFGWLGRDIENAILAKNAEDNIPSTSNSSNQQNLREDQEDESEPES
ncbi:unnamed protein product [Caenorhabditis angaria]|uniref:THAP-type domain-containing protein n=1 Tax=Caenorhabditis angaria TaxID=860376 RepID=A0A9P1I7J0_9PELO|nr:unnamed protein product [Caenorhabditis angaria]